MWPHAPPCGPMQGTGPDLGCQGPGHACGTSQGVFAGGVFFRLFLVCWVVAGLIVGVPRDRVLVLLACPWWVQPIVTESSRRSWSDMCWGSLRAAHLLLVCCTCCGCFSGEQACVCFHAAGGGMPLGRGGDLASHCVCCPQRNEILDCLLYSSGCLLPGSVLPAACPALQCASKPRVTWWWSLIDGQSG